MQKFDLLVFLENVFDNFYDYFSFCKYKLDIEK